MPRIFLGIPLDLPARIAVHKAQEIMRKNFRHSKISWVAPENFHITLHFIGEVQEATVDALKKELARIQFPEAFSLTLGDIGAFPHAKDPKTLYVSTNTHPFLFVLRKRLADVIANFGLRVDSKPYTPHITIGRVNSRAETLDTQHHFVEPVHFLVDHIELLESTLTPDGSIYSVLKTYALPSLHTQAN